MVYEISIFHTEELEDNKGRTPGNNVKNALNVLAYSGYGQFDLDVNVRLETLPTYVEDLNTTVWCKRDHSVYNEVPNPDDEGYVSYDNLFQYWGDYCKYQIDDWKLGSHSNLLLTAGDARDDPGPTRGIGDTDDDSYAVARVGHECADFEWNHSSGESKFHDKSNGYHGVQTAIHEIGHNLIKYESNEDWNDTCDDQHHAHHRMGNIFIYDNNEYSDTMMSNTGYNECMSNGYDENYCSNSVNFDDVDEVTARDLRFSACTMINFR